MIREKNSIVTRLKRIGSKLGTRDVKQKYHYVSEAELKKFHEDINNIKKELSKVVVGQEKVIDGLLRAMISNGHVLLEGVPGIAKTLIMRSLAYVTSCKTKRIQFTADLLPSDIIGLTSYERTKGFYIIKGPVFTNFLLADEINRAPAKVQSALLEAMQEKQVTIGRETFKIDEPFFVLATQNPIETMGSLTLDQEVLINGKLMNGYALEKHVQKYGVLKNKNKNGSFYKLKNGWTYTLAGNRFRKFECMPYFIEYNDYTYEIKTKKGRTIKVTKNHPFLVNKNGDFKWINAENLKLNDFLVSPKKIPEEDNCLIFKNHDEIINELRKDYKIASYEDILLLRKKTNGFKDFGKLSYEEFDKLRIYLGYSKKKLNNAAFDADKNRYYALVKFLRKGTKNKFIINKLILFFKKCEFDLLEKHDAIESYRITKIKPFSIDEDIVFWLAFLFSDGSVNRNYLAAYQKNYPMALDRFISIAKNKIGCGISDISEDNGCRRVVIRSKPLVDYIKKRFLINDNGIPYEYINLPADLRKEFLKTFVSLEGCVSLDTIACIQKNKQSVNVLSYLLLKEGFVHTIQLRENNIYALRIRDKYDVNNYLNKIGWIDNRKILFNRYGINGKRRISVNPKDFLEISKLLGLNSFHAYKERKKFLERNWYCAYKSMQQGNNNISIELFDNMVSDIRNEIDYRAFADVDYLSYFNIHHLAVLGGISLSNIKRNVGCSNHSVWKLYTSGKSLYKDRIINYVKNEYTKKLLKANKILNKYENMVSDEIFFDEVVSINKSKYEGTVFGLSVPKYHNYLGGFGACGINHNTYALPEAQIDRFLFKLYITYPSKKEERGVLEKNISLRDFSDYKLRPVVSPLDIIKMQEIAKKIFISDAVQEYIVRIVDATRYPEKYNLKNAKYIRFGSSPRASIGLYIVSKANALMKGKDYVTPQDVKEIAHDVLRHRILLNYEGQAEDINRDHIIDEILAKVPIP